MRRISAISFFTFAFISCNNQSNKPSSVSSKDTITQAVLTAASNAADQSVLPPLDELTMGVCRLQQGTFPKSVKLYDENEILTDSIVLNDETEPRLHPWAYKTDYGNLVFRVLAQYKNYYQVISDEEKTRIAFLKKDDPAMIFQTWDQHILQTFTVEFDEQSNPIRKQPDSNAAVIKVNMDIENNFHPVTIQNEWMQVEWGDGSVENKGWIRWKEGNKRIIEFYYLS